MIKTKSVEYMPFFLSFFLFLNGGIWSVYAALVKDFYIGVSFLIHLLTVMVLKILVLKHYDIQI